MKIIGKFYFILTKNGNLLGEFTNNGMNGNWDIESANKNGNDNVDFVGKFISTWLEDEKSFKAVLEIERIDEIIYKLNWKNLNGTEIFSGNAKLENDILIGNYTNEK
ncbi:hypothetical protein SL053_002495 [Flavobacterium psychrophilum]|nr:hypothetical protein [Flavobacterium psychrophilum]